MIHTWLAFDIGTTAAKAALVNAEGRILSSVTREYATHQGEGGVVEQHAADWWQAALEAARALDLSGVEAIALTGQMQNLILLDAEFLPVRPVILYSDTRAHAEVQAMRERLGAAQLRELTGNEQGPDSLLAKLLWLARNEPGAFAESRRLLLGAADYLALKLVGSASTDTTTASTTGLMDLNTRVPLDARYFEMLGLAEVIDWMPPVVAGGACVGEVTGEAAETLGLKAGIPVHLGPGDAGAATLGAGSGEPGAAYLYLGTSGWVAFTDPKPAKPGHGVITLAHPQEHRYIQVAPLLTAGGNLEWVRGLFGGDDYASLIEAALDRPPARLLYLPYLAGERAPFSDSNARAAFIGIDARTNQADICRAVLEGVVYAYRHALDTLVDTPPARLTLTGGGTRSQAWCRRFADIINVPVDVAGNAENVGVRGAVLAAQVCTGAQDDYTPQGYFPVAGGFVPDEGNHALYDVQYHIFRDAYPVLKGIFARLNT